MTDDNGPAAEMPRYRCHKEVYALKLSRQPYVTKDGATIEFVEAIYAPMKLPAEVFARYKPKAGDYLVVYDDGYKSFSPAKAFEEGYTRI